MLGLDQFDLRSDEADRYVAVVDDHVNRRIDHRVVVPRRGKWRWRSRRAGGRLIRREQDSRLSIA
jgi:hypothetical protein